MVANSAKVSKPSGQGMLERWSRPAPRQVKLNVDASFHADDAAGATGAVIRDYKGQLIAANCSYVPNIFSAAMAEALAMREGLALACRLGCQAIVAESDSLETINSCTGVDTWWSESAPIFADIVDLASNIDKLEFKHIPREANLVAHEIARSCFVIKVNCTWDDDPPSFLLSSLINDVTMDIG
jgi:ribonuclease HI